MTESEWFAPKRFGFGPGKPISWQGWALTIAFVAITVTLCFALRKDPVQMVAALILPTVAFVVISCRMTRGGCRWRSGKDES